MLRDTLRGKSDDTVGLIGLT